MRTCCQAINTDIQAEFTYRNADAYQQILNEVREGLACEYLSGSSLPIEEIAALLGYSAPGNFTNAFKRWRGCSPREYRNQQQAPVRDN